MIDRRIEPKKAAPKPSTLNPGVILPANSNIKALITKVNNPSVSMVIGNVSISKTGLISALTSPIMAIATRADQKSDSLIPEIILETRNNASALSIQFAMIFIICSLYMIYFFRGRDTILYLPEVLKSVELIL